MASQLPLALGSFLIDGNLGPVEQVLADFFSEHEVREHLAVFFYEFATSDVFQEVRDLANYLRTADNLQFYLNLCELRYQSAAYPLFYVPATVTLEESGSAFLLEFDTRLFVNERAIDYICQEDQNRTGRLHTSSIQERIHFPNEQE